MARHQKRLGALCDSAPPLAVRIRLFMSRFPRVFRVVQSGPTAPLRLPPSIPLRFPKEGLTPQLLRARDVATALARVLFLSATLVGCSRDSRAADGQTHRCRQRRPESAPRWTARLRRRSSRPCTACMLRSRPRTRPPATPKSRPPASLPVPVASSCSQLVRNRSANRG